MAFPFKQPGKWAITPALVAPEWKWFWDSARCVFPFWDYPIESAPAKNIQAFGSLPNIATAPTTSSIRLEVVSTPFGHAIRGERQSNEAWASLPCNRVIPPTATSATMFLFLRLADATAIQRLMSFGRTASQVAFSLRCGLTDNVVDVNARTSAGGLVTLDSASATYTAGEILTIVATFRHNDLRLYIRGELANSETTADLSKTLQDMDPVTYKINGSPSGGNTGDCEYLLGGVSLDVWSADQVRQWDRDPFGPIRMMDEVGVVVGLPTVGALSIPVAMHEYRQRHQSVV